MSDPKVVFEQAEIATLNRKADACRDEIQRVLFDNPRLAKTLRNRLTEIEGAIRLQQIRLNDAIRESERL